MKISIKRTCEGCKALIDIQGPNSMGCSLGYDNKKLTNSKLFPYEIKPQEPCPKPRTYALLLIAPKKE